MNSKEKEHMRKAKELRRRLLVGAFSLVLALGIFGIGFWMTGISGYAAAQATVTAPNGAKIRQDASTSSTMVGGAEKGKVLNVLSEVQGSDGYTWYQVQVNDTTTGYIRSDLVEVIGEVAPTEGGEGEGGEGEGGETAPPVEVSQVNPVSATVFDDLTEIMDTASASGQSLGSVPRETIVTVTGYVDDAENVRWYQAEYAAEGSTITGFILSEHLVLAAELTPLGSEPAPGSEITPPDDTPRYELRQKDGQWLLVDNEENPGYGYPVDQLLGGLELNKTLYEESEAKVKSQKIIIIVLVFLLVGAVAGIAFLVFKVREMSDSAYFNEVENETLRRRNASGGQGKSAREAGVQKAPMHTVGPEKQSARPVRQAEGGQRPGPAQRPGSQGQRPAGGTQGQRTSGQRIASPQGQRTMSGTQGQRPAGGSQDREMGGAAVRRGTGMGAAQRPVGGVQGQRASAPQGQRPAGASQGQRPASQGGRRPEGTPGQASQGGKQRQAVQGGGQKAQPKNFMAEDDDDFDFEFLNYDGEEEQ